MQEERFRITMESSPILIYISMHTSLLLSLSLPLSKRIGICRGRVHLHRARGRMPMGWSSTPAPSPCEGKNGMTIVSPHMLIHNSIHTSLLLSWPYFFLRGGSENSTPMRLHRGLHLHRGRDGTTMGGHPPLAPSPCEKESARAER